MRSNPVIFGLVPYIGSAFVVTLALDHCAHVFETVLNAPGRISLQIESVPLMSIVNSSKEGVRLTGFIISPIANRCVQNDAPPMPTAGRKLVALD
jgi:hypothetical protein